MNRAWVWGVFFAVAGCATPDPGRYGYKYVLTNHGYSLVPNPPPAPPAPPAPAPVAKVDPCAPDQSHTPDQCPDLDDDGDGIPNGSDQCPLEKGIAELQGCPPKDADGDGVPDHLDKCPSEAGTAEFQGCPPPKAAKLEAGRISILENVFFDTGKATLQERSSGVLDDVATVLKAHPEVQKVVVGGHTDSTGSAKFNRKLSLGRAEAVKAYLVAKGIEAARLEAAGFGPDKPIAPNKTKAGREKNRRVEFTIP